jgi:hypothetical protein
LGFIGIDFINGDEHRFAAAAEAFGDFTVERDDAFLDVDDEDDDVGGLDGEGDLFDGGLDDDVAGFFAAKQPDSAGVNESERASAPFGFGADAIAGDARLIVDDGDAASDDAIEQG